MHTPTYIAAADIGGTNLRLALAPLENPHSILARTTLSTVGTKHPTEILTQLDTALTQLLTENHIPRQNLKSLAATAPGIVNTTTGTVIVTSYLLGWRDVPLRSLLEQKFQLPAAVDNDAKLAALGEAHAGAGKNLPDFLFLAIGTGLSAGIILNHQLHRGANFTAGEIGYMLLPNLPPEPPPRGQPGALEAAIAGEGIKSNWLARWSPIATSLPQNAQPTEIFDHAPTDPLAQSLLTDTARTLAAAIYNISLLLDLPLFLLGGSIGLHPALRETTATILHSWGTRIRPQLSPAQLGPDAQLHGALHLAHNLLPS